jgi:hypothetical protein
LCSCVLFLSGVRGPSFLLSGASSRSSRCGFCSCVIDVRRTSGGEHGVPSKNGQG